MMCQLNERNITQKIVTKREINRREQNQTQFTFAH